MPWQEDFCNPSDGFGAIHFMYGLGYFTENSYIDFLQSQNSRL